MLRGLWIEDAEEMVVVLGDEALYEFTGGRPPELSELRDRYRCFVAGPENRATSWLNWTVRSRAEGCAIGTVQATVTDSGSVPVATLAWVIGTRWQDQGFASEAALAAAAFLSEGGVFDLRAHIAACHHVSAAVARHLGMHATAEQVEGEIVWRTL